MSHKFIGEHGKRYAQCVVCLKVLKFGEKQRAEHENTPMHCGKLARFLNDSTAREIIEGRPFKGPRRRLVGIIQARGDRTRKYGQ